MDISYILQNTIIYGSMAFVLASVFSQHKYLNFSVGAFMIWIAYIMQSIFQNGFSLFHIVYLGCIAGVFYFLDYFVYKSFTHRYTRELFGLIFTL